MFHHYAVWRYASPSADGGSVEQYCYASHRCFRADPHMIDLEDPVFKRVRLELTTHRSPIFEVKHNQFTYHYPVSIHLGSTYVQSCGNPRDTIIAEYAQYGVSFTPTCADFTQNAHSAHFSFAELNSGDFTWAIITNSLLTGLECVRTGNGNVALTINSGYRNPAHNAAVGGESQSRHMFGDAADIASNAGTWQALHNAGKTCGACVEPQSGSGAGHVHVDWRGSCPQGW